MEKLKFFLYPLSFFYPNRCPFCGTVIEPTKRCCDICLPNIKPEPRKFFVGNRWLCTSPFDYADQYKKAVFRLKFGDSGQISDSMSLYMAESVRECLSDYSFDIVTFVPMHRKRKNKSLYNHSKLLAEGTAKVLGLPVKPLLIKTKYNKPQHTLKPEERKKNVKGTFGIGKKMSEYIKNKTVLICDDVLTTGSTLSECCKVLEKAGAKDVFCVTFSKA